jgi:hypothetical protein
VVKGLSIPVSQRMSKIILALSESVASGPYLAGNYSSRAPKAGISLKGYSIYTLCSTLLYSMLCSNTLFGESRPPARKRRSQNAEVTIKDYFMQCSLKWQNRGITTILPDMRRRLTVTLLTLLYHDSTLILLCYAGRHLRYCTVSTASFLLL